VADDLLGHAFLPGGLLARYECGAEECVLFVGDLGAPAAARRALARLREIEVADGAAVDESAPSIGEDGFRARDPGLGPITVTRIGGFVVGVWGSGSREDREAILGHCAQGLLETRDP
jgi:hypothetical protein